MVRCQRTAASRAQNAARRGTGGWDRGAALNDSGKVQVPKRRPSVSDGDLGYMFSISYEMTAQGYPVCRPAGELDAFSVHRVRQALAEQASSRPLVIDLTGVSFIDSAGLGAL